MSKLAARHDIKEKGSQKHEVREMAAATKDSRSLFATETYGTWSEIQEISGRNCQESINC